MTQLEPSLALAARLEERVFGPTRAAGSELSVLAVTDPPPPIEIRRSPHGSWWLAANSDADPMALSNEGFTYAPSDVIDNLRLLRKAGVDFDYIFVLHEIPGDWQPGTPLPKMKLAGTGESTTAPVIAAQEATFEVGRQLLRAAGSVVGIAATGMAALAAGAASVAFDPVVLGGIEDPETGQIAWVGLAAWDEVPR